MSHEHLNHFSTTTDIYLVNIIHRKIVLVSNISVATTQPATAEQFTDASVLKSNNMMKYFRYFSSGIGITHIVEETESLILMRISDDAQQFVSFSV